MTKQIEDWLELRELCLSIQEKTGEERELAKVKLFHGVREYNNNYKTKFDYFNRPNDNNN